MPSAAGVRMLRRIGKVIVVAGLLLALTCLPNPGPF
jgi:uncharacterized protein YjeT (DUF2065 family)